MEAHFTATPVPQPVILSPTRPASRPLFLRISHLAPAIFRAPAHHPSAQALMALAADPWLSESVAVLVAMGPCAYVRLMKRYLYLWLRREGGCKDQIDQTKPIKQECSPPCGRLFKLEWRG